MSQQTERTQIPETVKVPVADNSNLLVNHPTQCIDPPDRIIEGVWSRFPARIMRPIRIDFRQRNRQITPCCIVNCLAQCRDNVLPFTNADPEVINLGRWRANTYRERIPMY